MLLFIALALLLIVQILVIWAREVVVLPPIFFGAGMETWPNLAQSSKPHDFRYRNPQTSHFRSRIYPRKILTYYFKEKS